MPRKKHTKTLLYAPLFHHVSSEMGKGYEYMVTMMDISVDELEAHSDEYMKKIEQVLSEYDNIDKLYMDSVGSGGKRAIKYLRRLKRRGSYTAKISLDLVKRGIRPMKTDSSLILDKISQCTAELEFIFKEVVKNKKKIKTKEQAEGIKKLIDEISEKEKRWEKKREAYIPRRIGMTLRPGETGVLLMGAEHDLKFDRSIGVVYLVDPKDIVEETEKKFFDEKKMKDVLSEILDS